MLPLVALGKAVLLYDGECGLCHGLVQWLWPRDTAGKIYYVSLQSELARTLLQPYGHCPSQLDTVYWLENAGTPQQQLYQRSTAALRALQHLGGVYRWYGLLLWIPVFGRDAMYWLVARYRYRWFGKAHTCLLPPPTIRIRFLA